MGRGTHVRASTHWGLRPQWLLSFREFPPRMKPGSFSLDRVMEAMTKADQAVDCMQLFSRMVIGVRARPTLSRLVQIA